MNNIRTNKGITLIALVITIIVLLILAAVSIATLTGENGILTKANTAKDLTIEAEEKEQINLAYTTVMADKLHSNSGNGLTVSAEELGTQLNNQNAGAKTQDKENNQIEVTFNKSRNVYTVNGGTGAITGPTNSGGQTPTEPEDELSTVEESKNKGTIFEEKTKIQDTFGNKVVVPEGFKIASDSGNNVTEGVVIEDVSYGETAGSQFVWIPVGEVKTANETKTIELSRYIFATDGTPAKQGENTINTYYQELESSSYGNTTAKDIEDFKTKASVSQSGGYYIGRYEARVANKRTAETTNDAELEKVTVKASDFVYNYVTQPQAAKLARAMYEGNDKTFTSDLINSYAWDTAIVYLQEFDNRETDRTKPYSIQGSLNTGSVAERGTNNLTDINQQDKICNIWDMASNDFEWTTETSTISNSPCVVRGGGYGGSSSFTSYRSGGGTTYAYDDYSFRLALYL